MWTNRTLEKALGEHGFFVVNDSTVEVVPKNKHERKTWRTAWTRETKLVYMVTVDDGEPHIEDSSGNVLDINSLGYRNPAAPEAWRVT